jgi:hypothetical protein
MDFVADSAANFGMDLPSRDGHCPRGFSPMQIVVLSVLKACLAVITYWQIAQLVNARFGLQTTKGAVRGILERLFRRGFIVRERSANGRMHGNRYAFSADPCPHIPADVPRMEFGADSGVQSAAQSGENALRSVLRKDKIDKDLSISSEEAESMETARKLDALTEDDIAFHWPELAREGFGTHQIRQIFDRLAQVNIEPERISQGLIHAEWELTAGKMRDKSGNPVSSLVKWVFKILATQGYYPRPDGYVSPQEQAELDAAEEAKRLTIARKTRFETDCDAWIAGLSQEQRRTILAEQQSQFLMPEHIVFSRYYREKIRPVLEGGEAQNSTVKAAGHVD